MDPAQSVDPPAKNRRSGSSSRPTTAARDETSSSPLTRPDAMSVLVEVNDMHTVAAKEYAKNIMQQIECWRQLNSLRKRETQLNRFIKEVHTVLNPHTN